MNAPQFGNFLIAAADQYRVLGWIVLLPLLGAIINGVLGKRIGRDGVYIVGVGTVAASFLLSLLAFAALLKAGATDAAAAAAAAGDAAHGAEEAARPLTQLSYMAGEWFHGPIAGGVGAPIKFRFVLDALSGLMLLVVTGVGTLIHLYSTGYMSHDEGYARYFAYLNLFMFSMLMLILADNIVLLFVGWEGVGLCSYLLIGFWFTNSQYAAAGKKAFIVNRIGDVGAILGMTILAWKVGGWDFGTMRTAIAIENGAAMHDLAQRPELNDFLASTLSFGVAPIHDFIYRIVPSFTWGGLACFLLFIGCTGKSAQLPLYVWLPDAMAGPTPVSALIHAATMVTAGIYLLCRLSFVYVYFPSVMAVIAVIGGLTALFAATIALTQNELKKVLAYSTVSQLGFMFLGCGVGAFGAGIFHVYTHAMFKACLFLGAGAVMHACRDKVDIRELGGLKKYLPITFATFTAATLAIIGTPGFSGFFSKDEILFRALASHNEAHPWVGKFTFALGVMAATLTAFYMCRLLFLTFWGEFKGWSLEPATAGAADAKKIEHAAPPTADKLAAHDHDAHAADAHGHGHGNPWDPPQENPWNITTPLIVLGVMSVIAGYIGLPYLFTHHESVLAHFLGPAVSEWHIDHAAARSTEVTAMLMGVGAFLVGSGSAYWVYVMQKGEPARALVAAGPMRPIYRFVYDKWKVDELYDLLIVRPLRGISSFAAFVFDRWVIDGIVRLVGILPRGLALVLRKFQTGAVHTYGAVMALGMVAILAWVWAMPAATIQYRVDGTTATGQVRVALQAYGGPGYSFEWDPEGDGTFEPRTAQTAQNASCVPVERPSDGHRVCRVALRVRNAFGFTREVTRTIDMNETDITEDRH